MKSWFASIENNSTGTRYPLEKVIAELTFGADGLMPVIIQDYSTQQVLMFAYMNKQALKETLETGKMCYWSRSRKKLWRKGESSGHWQTVRSIRTDCDGDVLLAEVDQDGSACHTMRRSCFYLKFEQDQVTID